MEAIALDPGSYEGTYKLVGEQVSLDFVNTISWPGTEKAHDWLDSPANFISWLVAAGLMSRSQARKMEAGIDTPSRKELNQAHRIRKELLEVLSPLGLEKKPSKEAIARLNTLVQSVSHLRHISPVTHQWEWRLPLSFTDALAPVIWNAATVLTSMDHSRIRHCPSCDWLFYDSTRNRSRKWCVMEDCGSRDKSLRYYHRQKD